MVINSQICMKMKRYISLVEQIHVPVSCTIVLTLKRVRWIFFIKIESDGSGDGWNYFMLQVVAESVEKIGVDA